MATIQINGVDVPSPVRGLEQIVTTTVNAGRNANNVVVGEPIGRDQYKLNNLEWRMMKADEWATICQLFSAFFVTVRMFDMTKNDWITLKMYPGDRSAVPYFVDEEGKPTVYESCKVNIIDCGVIE